MRTSNRFSRSTLDSDEIKRIIDAAAVRGVRAVSFTGGEPMLFLDDLVDYMTYAGAAGMEYIRTGTNGFIFAGPDKPGFETRVKRAADKLAGSPVRNFWISIDSADPEVHERMRGFPGAIRGLEKALPWFHERGLYPSANLGLNRNTGGGKTGALALGPSGDPGYLDELERDCRRAFRDFYRFVIDLGFTMVNTCYPMSTDEDGDENNLSAVYAATSTDMVVRFRPKERVVLFRALMETIPEFRSRIRIFSPLTSLHALVKQYETGPEDAYPCRGGIDFFFIDARDGRTYPCGYRGNDDLGKLWDLDLGRVDRKAECHRCDWECFRDPSELFGPFLNALSNPASIIRKFRRDPKHLKLWIGDLRYYRACRFFNGREPMDERRLKRF
jgi:MoaA/NifB/PqqE/SkfB family radical SAM enzyme